MRMRAERDRKRDAFRITENDLKFKMLSVRFQADFSHVLFAFCVRCVYVFFFASKMRPTARSIHLKKFIYNKFILVWIYVTKSRLNLQNGGLK